jgi:hypothetical protein
MNSYVPSKFLSDAKEHLFLGILKLEKVAWPLTMLGSSKASIEVADDLHGIC